MKIPSTGTDTFSFYIESNLIGKRLILLQPFSIRTTQRKFFDGRFIGVDGDSGVSLPDIQKITEAYGLKYTKIETVEDLEGGIQEVLDYEGPVVCEVMCQKWQEVVPTLISTKTKDGRIVSRPFEDMYPLLTREEFYDNMIIDPINYEE